jgi:hypothetical protein
MGSGSFTPADWDAYSTSRSYGSPTTTTKDIFVQNKLHPDLDPKGVKFRESCDSDDNPLSTGLIIGLDVTGSMHNVLDVMARNGLNTLCTEIYDRKPITNPHIMGMGIGDVEAGDKAPLQTTQFEADIRILDQLTKIWLEGGGGGNYHESYMLPWYFAAFHTKIDCFLKRKKKGYLFTIGDEEPQTLLRASHIEEVLGYRPQSDLTAEDLLAKVSQQYEVFHVMVAEGSNMRSYRDTIITKWRDLLSQRALILEDHTKLAEVIVSAIQVVEGTEKDKIVNSWDGTTGVVVMKAIEGLTTLNPSLEGVVRF